MDTKEVQADLPHLAENTRKIFIRPAERITLAPKTPPEPSAYGKYSNYSRPWILQDGRECPEKGSEMKAKYKDPVQPKSQIGIRRRMLRHFFWEQILEEALEELAQPQPVVDYCSEYDSNYIKENFEPRRLDVTADKDQHLKFPLYGTGSSAITYYSETIHKTGKGEILEKFRRTQDFTKPMSERLDDGWVL